MRKYLPALLISFLSFSSNGQSQKNLPDALQISLGKSFHGSGDLRGVSFAVEYGHYFKKRLEIAGNITTTIHQGTNYLFVSTFYGNFDESLRYVTAGIQVNPKIGFAFVHTKNHELKAQAGGIFRYQSSSGPDSHEILSPGATGLFEPVYVIRQFEKQNIFTAGYTVDLCYSFTTGKNLLLGIKAGFQNDSNADVISHIGVVIGKRFRVKK